MDYLEITGGVPLIGDIKISGAKNAALPLLTAGLMTSETLTLDNVPSLADTLLMEDLLLHHGLEVVRDGETVTLAGAADNFDASYDLVRKMRASILVLGPLLARFGEARVSLPGGCAIGTRPVDLHIRAMQALGAMVELADGYIQARTSKGLKGAHVVFPMVSVGATENAMMAAALADGTSELVNVAREPEIIDLADCLNAMGARISGAGTDTLVIEGVSSLGAARHAVVADRIEAGTFAIAAAMTAGDLRLEGAMPKHLDALIVALRDAGAMVEEGSGYISVRAEDRMRSVDIVNEPFPGFPTDMQAQFTALNTVAQGTSRVTETVFENRLMQAHEMKRMGADIVIDGDSACITGRPSLQGAPVMASDLRASASLVIAGLVASGETRIDRIYHIDRGYENIEGKLQCLGANIRRIST